MTTITIMLAIRITHNNGDNTTTNKYDGSYGNHNDDNDNGNDEHDTDTLCKAYRYRHEYCIISHYIILYLIASCCTII